MRKGLIASNVALAWVIAMVGLGYAAVPVVSNVTASNSTYSGEMIYVPAGPFLMGSSSTGRDYASSRFDELPQHSVTLSGHYIGKYEVTRGEVQAIHESRWLLDSVLLVERRLVLENIEQRHAAQILA